MMIEQKTSMWCWNCLKRVVSKNCKCLKCGNRITIFFNFELKQIERVLEKARQDEREKILKKVIEVCEIYWCRDAPIFEDLKILKKELKK